MIEKMIEETYSLIQEPIYFTLKYDGTVFKLEIPIGIESSVMNCTASEYFNLEESIATALLHYVYVRAKTEIKEAKQENSL
jgi:hypothetical protein